MTYLEILPSSVTGSPDQHFSLHYGLENDGQAEQRVFFPQEVFNIFILYFNEVLQPLIQIREKESGSQNSPSFDIKEHYDEVKKQSEKNGNRLEFKHYASDYVKSFPSLRSIYPALLILNQIDSQYFKNGEIQTGLDSKTLEFSSALITDINLLNYLSAQSIDNLLKLAIETATIQVNEHGVVQEVERVGTEAPRILIALSRLIEDRTQKAVQVLAESPNAPFAFATNQSLQLIDLIEMTNEGNRYILGPLFSLIKMAYLYHSGQVKPESHITTDLVQQLSNETQTISNEHLKPAYVFPFVAPLALTLSTRPDLLIYLPTDIRMAVFSEMNVQIFSGMKTGNQITKRYQANFREHENQAQLWVRSVSNQFAALFSAGTENVPEDLIKKVAENIAQKVRSELSGNTLTENQAIVHKLIGLLGEVFNPVILNKYPESYKNGFHIFVSAILSVMPDATNSPEKHQDVSLDTSEFAVFTLPEAQVSTDELLADPSRLFDIDRKTVNDQLAKMEQESTHGSQIDVKRLWGERLDNIVTTLTHIVKGDSELSTVESLIDETQFDDARKLVSTSWHVAQQFSPQNSEHRRAINIIRYLLDINLVEETGNEAVVFAPGD